MAERPNPAAVPIGNEHVPLGPGRKVGLRRIVKHLLNAGVVE